MSHIPSHQNGTEEAHQSFLVIFKIHAETIHLWQGPGSKGLSPKEHQQQSFKIYCHNVETHTDHPGSDIQLFVLSEPAKLVDKCQFRSQQETGQELVPGDMAIFMTGPMSSSRKTAYAIDVGLGEASDSAQSEPAPTAFQKLGSAYVYLDPKFSSQGIQRTPIIATSRNHLPIGQIQIEYLIVTNPRGHGQPAPKPDWLTKRLNQHSGHRGSGAGRRLDLPSELLENTVASFKHAHRSGADMCELDVLLSADGVPVVYHDFDVDAVAAQQSSEQLGKFRVQVNEFTVKQLRDFRLLALHDVDGCLYTLNVRKQEEDNRPFPTLAEVLDKLDESCGLNIEIKWPQLLESGRMEARKYREVNDFVDRIIETVERHARNRAIILESFDADLVMMLRLKQNQFPVMFLSQGMTDLYERYMDKRARSVENGIYFAQAFDLAGVDILVEYYKRLGKQLVQFINDHDLVARTWGEVGENGEDLEYLSSLGLQCLTYDKIDLKKPKVGPGGGTSACCQICNNC